MMKFRTIKTAIVDTLTAGAAGNYTVYGSRKQSKGASEDLGTPRVTVFYQSGDFPKSGGSFQSNRIHEAIYRIEVTAIIESEADLTVLNNPSATAVQLAAALAAMPVLSDQADALLDEAFDNIYQVLGDAENYDLGLPVGTAVNMWISQIQKDDPVPRGEYFILTGNMRLEVRMSEEITGETGVPGVAYDTTIDIEDDQGDNAGASGTLGG